MSTINPVIGERTRLGCSFPRPRGKHRNFDLSLPMRCGSAASVPSASVVKTEPVLGISDLH